MHGELEKTYLKGEGKTILKLPLYHLPSFVPVKALVQDVSVFHVGTNQVRWSLTVYQVPLMHVDIVLTELWKVPSIQSSAP